MIDLDGVRYVRPKSLTWWGGVGLILLGAIGFNLDLILFGVVVIGGRDALWRMTQPMELVEFEIDPIGDDLPPGVIDPYGPEGSR